jgi:hypothetical protein
VGSAPADIETYTEFMGITAVIGTPMVFSVQSTVTGYQLNSLEGIILAAWQIALSESNLENSLC